MTLAAENGGGASNGVAVYTSRWQSLRTPREGRHDEWWCFQHRRRRRQPPRLVKEQCGDAGYGAAVDDEETPASFGSRLKKKRSLNDKMKGSTWAAPFLLLRNNSYSHSHKSQERKSGAAPLRGDRSQNLQRKSSRDEGLSRDPVQMKKELED
ncbi:uncharacterized protein LOC128197777 [Vigna angularis]|uniref:uncharacterized protein LOC128197777 n=1 Tax=Phaseolus angularis TaxID=3914 RepID=UPI0022B483AC|nr:uncharacterized protein LOC128197777 [Vigna angularis]